MKKIIFFLILIIPVTMFAQKKVDKTLPPFVKPEIDSVAAKGAREMKAKLNLSEAQEKQIYLLNRNYMKDRSNTSPGITAANRSEEMQILQQKYEMDIKEILTAEQFRQYISEMEERRKKMDQNREQAKSKINKG